MVAKRKKGSALHIAVDRLGHLLALYVTPANEQDRIVLQRTARFRRLARDYERLAETLVGLHLVAFAVVMLKRFAALSMQST